jgi:hypothetical protein
VQRWIPFLISLNPLIGAASFRQIEAKDVSDEVSQRSESANKGGVIPTYLIVLGGSLLASQSPNKRGVIPSRNPREQYFEDMVVSVR